MKLGLLSDIHEDIESLHKAISILDKKKCDELVCLGDIIGFAAPYYDFYQSRNASECLNLVRGNCRHILVGNHDLWAIRKLSDYNAGIEYPGNWFEMDYFQKKQFSKNRIWLYEENELQPFLTQQDKKLLENLPEIIQIEYSQRHFIFTHYLYPDLSGSSKKFIDNHFDAQAHFGFIKGKEAQFAFCGHTHQQGVGIVSSSLFKRIGFKKFRLKDELQIILLPCVAKGKNKNGIVVFDTDTLEIEAIRIK